MTIAGLKLFEIQVLESAPFWGPLLEREFPSSSVRVVPIDALPGQSSARSFSEEPACDLYLLELCRCPESTLHWLGRRASSLHETPTVIIVGHGHQWLQWTLRELGAAVVIDEQNGIRELTDACRRLLPTAAFV